MPPKENEVELSELIALEEQIEDLKDALYDAKVLLKSAIIIPKGATNGDMIMTMFPNAKIKKQNEMMIVVDVEDNGLPYSFWKDWWDEPFKKEVEE